MITRERILALVDAALAERGVTSELQHDDVVAVLTSIRGALLREGATRPDLERVLVSFFRFVLQQGLAGDDDVQLIRAGCEAFDVAPAAILAQFRRPRTN